MKKIACLIIVGASFLVLNGQTTLLRKCTYDEPFIGMCTPYGGGNEMCVVNTMVLNCGGDIFSWVRTED